MRGWFQFGYDGFPSGEVRRRFFRQRDDPWGSEEDNDYDDETNDRPVYYYPLRPSEEGSSSASVKSSGSTSGEDGDAMSGSRGSSARLPLYGHTTVYESTPALFGATAVVFHRHQVQTNGAVQQHYVLWHGGASLVDQWVSDAFTLARLVPAPGGVAYRTVPPKASLEALLHTPLSHPALRACQASAERHYGDWNFAPPRFGHCAVAVELPRKLATALLTKGLPEPTRDESGRVVCPAMSPFLASSVRNPDDYELHLSLVIGGTERSPAAVAARNTDGLGGRHHTNHPPQPHSQRQASPTRRAAHQHYGGSPSSPISSSSSLDTRVLGHIRSVTMSRPSLSFTLLQLPRCGTMPAHWTRSFELDGRSSQLPVEPRMFATLTPWPCQAWDEGGAGRGGGAEGAISPHTLAFLYLGGTETGLAPIPLFALTRIELNYHSWEWSSRVVPAFGLEPSPRFGHSTTYCPEDGCFLVFGGVGAGGAFLNDLHLLNGVTRVWREVFVPMGLGPPPRAFHCAPLLVLPTGERVSARGVSGGHIFLNKCPGGVGDLFHQPCTGELAGCDRSRGGVGEAEIATAIPPSTEESCLTSHPTGTGLLLVGGEGDAGVEPSVWLCVLDTGSWQLCQLPLFNRAESYHVDDTKLVGEGTEEKSPSPGPRAGSVATLSANRLQETIRALAERRRGEAWEAGATFGSSSLGDFFVSTTHGALAQALPLPDAFGGGVLLLGGTRSPPVLLATHLQLPVGTLKERVAFWALSQPHRLQTRLLRRAPAYYWHLLGHTRFADYVAALAPREQPASHAATALPPSSVTHVLADVAVEEAAEEAQRGPPSAAMADTHRLVSQGALEEQLSVWMRSTRRRLREERLS